MTLGGAVHDAVFLSQVVRDAPVPLWVVDDCGVVQLANRAAVAFLGYRHEGDVTGGPSHELLHRHRPDGSPYPEHECPIACSTGTLDDSEWFVTQAGDVRPVRWATQRIGSGGSLLLSFSAHASAEAAGRAPLTAARAPTVQGRDRVRASLRRSVARRSEDPRFSPVALAEEAGLSVRSLQALFAEVGESPAALIRDRRLERARGLLELGHGVQSTAEACGFLDVGTFARAHKRRFGFPPSATPVPVAPHPHPPGPQSAGVDGSA